MLSFGALAMAEITGNQRGHFVRLMAHLAVPGLCLSFLLIAPGRVTAASRSEAGALVVQVPAAEADVLKAVREVVNDSIIHGTYSYEKEKTLRGAAPAESSSLFDSWAGPGAVFYKVAPNILAPRHFKDTADLGVIAVRYVVQGIEPAATSVRIDAVYVEKNRRRVHGSDGSVEAAELAAIKEHIEALQLARTAAERANEPPAVEAANSNPLPEPALNLTASAPPGPADEGPVQRLERRLQGLRRQVEARVKMDQSPLKSAPFRSATTVQALPADTHVVVLILTPYWYGVETQDGNRGWLHRSQLEALP